MWRTICLIGLVLGYGWAGVRYAAVWETRLTCTDSAYRLAPHKPRTAINYALALMEVRAFNRAQVVLDQAWAARADPQIPPWDRRDAAHALMQDRQLLSRLANGSWPSLPARSLR